MKHWDPSDCADVAEVELVAADAESLRPRTARQPARPPLHAGSLIGLALALGMLTFLALLLDPVSPVSPLLD